MTSISVGMATYNGHKFIQRQLDSLAAQSHTPTELVVSDDASEDDTIALIEAFAKTAPFPVNIYRNKTRLGYSANFMQAANLCRSDLIAFCDQDDNWYPNKIAELIKPFNDPDVLLTYHNADIVTIDGRRIGALYARGTRPAVLPPMTSDPFISAPGFAMVFRRSLLPLSAQWKNSRQFHDATMPLNHDTWFFFLASVFGTIVYLDNPLVAYVQHGDNTLGWMAGRSFRQRAKVYFHNCLNENSDPAKAAECQGAILERLTVSLEGVWRDRATAVAERYRSLSRVYAELGPLYTAASFRDRLKTFRAVLTKGGYTGAWGLGPKHLIADLCLWVPLGPLLGRKPSLE